MLHIFTNKYSIIYIFAITAFLFSWNSGNNSFISIKMLMFSPPLKYVCCDSEVNYLRSNIVEIC